MNPVSLTIANSRAILTLTNSEQGNRLSLELLNSLGDALATLHDRSDYRAVTLRADGPHFCVGGSIDGFRAAESLPGHLAEILEAAHEVARQFAALPVPVISAIQGPAAGAGVGLALGADIVIAAEQAVFRSGYPAIGLSPDMGTSFQVIRRAGPTFAMDFLMTNRPLSAGRALAARLVNEVVAPDALDSRTEEISGQLARMPRASLAAIKRLVNDPRSDLHEHLELEKSEIMACARTRDAAEGITAFAEKRPPVFGET